MSIPYPARVTLARLPTPLDPAPRTGAALGIELYVKRDDLTGAELSGNKVRKLEFLLAEALAEGADTVVTCGGEQSNHCRATALAAARLGLRSRLLLRTVDPTQPPPTEANILLDLLAGAEIVWISHADYARRAKLMQREADRLAAAGRKAYLIPEGGSNALGSWGYVRAAEELVADLADLPRARTTVIYAAGSGGTGAGLLLGAQLAGLDAHVAGVNVCDDRDYFVRVIGGICADFDRRFGTSAAPAAGAIDIIDGYVGAGYARSRPDELELLRDVARADGLVLDPVYTGKAFYGLREELRRDSTRFGERVVFVHTGGIYGLFAKSAELAPLL